jgi:hypothetical protein
MPLSPDHLSRWSALGVFAVVALVLAGCVERTERIEVLDDGSILMQLRFEADGKNELVPGRVPTAAGGWSVTHSTRRDDDGKVSKHILTADHGFDLGTPLPDSHAPPDLADGDRYLQFPTTLEIEPRADGTHYHFRRVYPARPRAFIAVLEREALAPIGIESTDGLEIESMSDDEIAAIVRALTRVEVEKMLVFARAAYVELTPFRAQDGWLAVRASALAVYETIGDDHYRDFVRALRRAAEGDTDTEIELASEDFTQSIRDAMREALRRSCRYDGALVDAFDARYQWHADAFAITEGLRNEKLTIEVTMPGEIVAANTDDVEGNRATWTFNGSSLWDRELELMVTGRK